MAFAFSHSTHVRGAIDVMFRLVQSEPATNFNLLSASNLKFYFCAGASTWNLALLYELMYRCTVSKSRFKSFSAPVLGMATKSPFYLTKFKGKMITGGTHNRSMTSLLKVRVKIGELLHHLTHFQESEALFLNWSSATSKFS